jgi:hypothetical protein
MILTHIITEKDSQSMKLIMGSRTSYISQIQREDREYERKISPMSTSQSQTLLVCFFVMTQDSELLEFLELFLTGFLA